MDLTDNFLMPSMTISPVYECKYLLSIHQFGKDNKTNLKSCSTQKSN